MLKVVILSMYFEGDITFVISELKAKVSLREFRGFYGVENRKRRLWKSKERKAIIIGDITNLTVDINRLRKKYKREDLKDKDYKRAYSRSKGCYFGGG